MLYAAMKFSTNARTACLCFRRHWTYTVPSVCVDEASARLITVFVVASFALILMRGANRNVSEVKRNLTAVLFWHNHSCSCNCLSKKARFLRLWVINTILISSKGAFSRSLVVSP